jgi:hypothetical protein
MEVSLQEAGKILGLDVTDVGTFVAFERSGGQMYAEGQGITMSATGESAIWNGHGVGHPTGQGLGMSIRFSIAYQAGAGPLSRLNDCLVIGEFESDADGNVKITMSEWK